MTDELRALKARFEGLDLRLARFGSGLGALEVRMSRLVRRLERLEARLDDGSLPIAAPRALSEDPWPV
jgi:hypothetical protein